MKKSNTKKTERIAKKTIKAWGGFMCDSRGKLMLDKKGESSMFGMDGVYRKGQRWAYAIYSSRKNARKAYECVRPITITIE